MCVSCSRRHLIAGAASFAIFGPSASLAMTPPAKPDIACGFNSDNDYQNMIKTRRSMPGGEAGFHRALVAELKNILAIVPVEPGFQYVDSRNAYALKQTFVPGTKGTVMIGVQLVKELLEPNDGGISVAGVLAHECAHIFQYYSAYYDQLNGTTPVFLELHADVLAGYYLSKKLGASAGRLRVMQQELIKIGTYNNADPSHHGTPGQRNAALDKGYMLAQSGKSFERAAEDAVRYVRTLV